MKKQQIILVSSGFLSLILLFFLGKTTTPKINKITAPGPLTEKIIESGKLITHARERLTPTQVQWISSLENSVKRGDVKIQQINVYRRLADFWRDSIHLFEPYAYYTAEAAKLENSEKSLTFAAHLFFTNLKSESDPPMQRWLATNAKDLFSRALQINPANDSSKIGMGACYIFGNLSDNPMEGISLIREVIQRDPKNMYGQFILGLGGIKSGQYDKAIERFKIVVGQEPKNVEAMLNLAETYDRKGEKAAAVRWYKNVKVNVNNADAQKELDARIKTLQ